ncbi:hypothetical protein HK099_002483 [Clydaea vesicula]|uniref:Peptidase A1 domain-containing protein n=1 Tax=Clydaea vesicula TaxID=447962 RepID=A0AAD5U2M7_9FUNG|nr:hypothetical protein HK099_002483 [Clydaea vesicula]
MSYRSSISGSKATDIVGFGDMRTKNFTFIEAISLSDDNFLDGIVGMALYNNPSHLFMDYVKPTLNSFLFSYWLSGDNMNGEIIFGGVDETKFIGDFTWIYTDPNRYHWTAYFDGISIVTSSGIVSSIEVPKLKTVIFDTGTSVSYLSLQLAETLNKRLGGTLFQNFTTDTTTAYQVDCANLKKLPTIKLNIGGEVLSLNPEEYILLFHQNGPCVSVFFGNEVRYLQIT